MDEIWVFKGALITSETNEKKIVPQGLTLKLPQCFFVFIKKILQTALDLKFHHYVSTFNRLARKQLKLMKKSQYVILDEPKGHNHTFYSTLKKSFLIPAIEKFICVKLMYLN